MLRYTCLPVLAYLAAGCGGIYREPVQALSARWCGQVPGGLGEGVAAGAASALWGTADGFVLGCELALAEEGDQSGCALGVCVLSGPELFYLLAAKTPPRVFEYVAPWVGLGAGMTFSNKVGVYGELKAGVCLFLPEIVRLRAGYAWGLARGGDYDGFRAGVEFLF